MKNGSILIIDDNMGHRDAIQQILQNKHYTVYAAQSGKIGLEYLKDFPDITILVVDLEMPDMSGVDVLEAIKEWDKPLRRIVLTAYDEDLSAQDAEALNVYSYLSKPISKHILLFTVKSAFNDLHLEATQKELDIAKQWEELGQITADFVHVVGNKVGIIPNFIDSIKDEMEHIPPKAHEKFDHIKEIVHQIHSMKEELLMPFRKSPMRKVNVCDVLKKAIANRDIPTDIQITQNHENEKLHVYVNPLELQKVFEELITNAIDAMKESETKEIKISTLDATGSVEITFQDTGCGLKEVDIGDFFRPFFTTKDNPHFGLGLFSIKNTLAKFDGTISCSSTLDKGTIFSINLPTL